MKNNHRHRHDHRSNYLISLHAPNHPTYHQDKQAIFLGLPNLRHDLHWNHLVSGTQNDKLDLSNDPMISDTHNTNNNDLGIDSSLSPTFKSHRYNLKPDLITSNLMNQNLDPHTNSLVFSTQNCNSRRNGRFSASDIQKHKYGPNNSQRMTSDTSNHRNHLFSGIQNYNQSPYKYQLISLETENQVPLVSDSQKQRPDRLVHDTLRQLLSYFKPHANRFNFQFYSSN